MIYFLIEILFKVVLNTQISAIHVSSLFVEGCQIMQVYLYTCVYIFFKTFRLCAAVSVEKNFAMTILIQFYSYKFLSQLFVIAIKQFC